jgi:sigma-B regulation protein RsbU (phosphoserine phosphatase)
VTATILIADDNVIDRRILRAILERGGHQVIDASNGEDALRLAREDRPDLALFDVVMPTLNGYDACSALKADAATSTLPVLFLSSLKEARHRVRGLAAGAGDFITKPYDAEEVLARVGTHLALSFVSRSLREANAALEAQRARIDEDLRAAAEIQQALLPREGLNLPGLAFAWRFEPCATIGGDIFNFVELPGGMTAVYMIDVSGHGVPSSLVAVSVAQSLAATSPVFAVPSPAGVLAALERRYPLERFGTFFTACVLLFERDGRRFRYSAAGHPPPLLLHADGRLETLGAGGPVVGLGREDVFEEGAARLEQGARIVLYTDGILDLEDPDGVFYGGEQFGRRIASCPDPSAEDLSRWIMADLARHRAGRPPRDDVSLLVLEAVP